MTTEQKAEAYDRALELAKSFYEGPELVWDYGDLERLFPELKSEDEKSKEWILKYLYYGLGKSDEQFKEQFKTAIAWLESLKPQTPWKPTASQMSQLKWIAHQNADNMIGKELMTLYEDLKKLTE